MDSADDILRSFSTTQQHATWSNVKMILSQKIKNIEKDFLDSATSIEDIDIPNYPNVDNFNFDRLRTSLLDRLELFHAPPFTIQRICELLVEPKKHYSRIDKFMRALEKNILVVSTVSDGRSNFDLSLNGSGEILIDQKSSESSDRLNLDSTQDEEKNSPLNISKESNIRRLDDEEESDSPSPKKMRLDNDIHDESNDIDFEKGAEEKVEESCEEVKDNVEESCEAVKANIDENRDVYDVKESEQDPPADEVIDEAEKPTEINQESKEEEEKEEIQELTKETQIEDEIDKLDSNSSEDDQVSVEQQDKEDQESTSYEEREKTPVQDNMKEKEEIKDDKPVGLNEELVKELEQEKEGEVD